jgi:phenylacetate-CoA ligase
MLNAKPERLTTALERFLSTPIDTLLQRHLTESPEEAALALFRDVSATVPAYRSFLDDLGIDPGAVRTIADFQALPPVTKENYVQRYPLRDLCRHGDLSTCDFISVSSGSTGAPTCWPRFAADELSIAARFEQIFHDSFHADTRPTLAVVCFALGTWVGGMYTASCCRHLAAKGYPITVITPGNNKPEILRVVRELGPAFDQVVLLGYPPFLKDVIDSGRAEGVEWAKFGIKIVCAGEVFSEEWRTLVGERTGSSDLECDSASLYGTADAGVLGNETPLSIHIRRFLAGRPEAARALFGESRLPTLVQYDPLSRFFESTPHGLLFTGDNGIPLIRYNILDTGGVVPYDDMLEFLAGWGCDPLRELQASGRRGVHKLPFVYVFGRSNFTVSYFGANIYPENVSVGLEQPRIKEWVTGKFVLQVVEDEDKNAHLSVIVELAPGVAAGETERAEIAESILAQLLRLNSEFANYVPAQYRMPRVALKPAGDAEYFPAGVKHRYTRR